MGQWLNEYTGEVYRTLPEAIKTIIEDMRHFPKCRTPRMLKIRRTRSDRMMDIYKDLECISPECRVCDYWDADTDTCNYEIEKDEEYED